jgi:hypothetical protein
MICEGFAGFQARTVDDVPRSEDSPADRELTAQLAARGLAGSGTRYERWRRAGLLPRHERHGAGQGHGSISALDPATVEIAAAIARHTVQGRDLRGAIVAWFFEAGRPALPGHNEVPEPPDAVVADALAWAMRTDPAYRMLQRARSAITEDQKDEFYAATGDQARRLPDPSLPDPQAVRDSILGGPKVQLDRGGPRADLAHLVAAIGLGVDEVGPEAFADAISASGLFPQLSREEWREVMIEAHSSGIYAKEFKALARFDPASALENANIDQLRQAREVTMGLAGLGALLLMHGLLMPDTPGLAALRTRINELGMAPVLMNMARQVRQPRGIASAIATCLDPSYLKLYESLYKFIADGPPLLHRAEDDKHDPERYMEDWISSLRKLGERANPG